MLSLHSLSHSRMSKSRRQQKSGGSSNLSLVDECLKAQISLDYNYSMTQDDDDGEERGTTIKLITQDSLKCPSRKRTITWSNLWLFSCYVVLKRKRFTSLKRSWRQSCFQHGRTPPQSTFDLFSSLRSFLRASCVVDVTISPPPPYACEVQWKKWSFSSSSTPMISWSVIRGLERNELEDFMIIYEERKQISLHRYEDSNQLNFFLASTRRFTLAYLSTREWKFLSSSFACA